MDKLSFVKAFQTEAEKAAFGSNVYPQVILAAAAVESGWGATGLALRAFNFFGIKADAAWKGATTSIHTYEVVDDKTALVMAQFRCYRNAKESFQDYVTFLEKNPRYEKALATSISPDDQILEIAQAGYSTNPLYAHLVTTVMHEIEKLMS